MTNSQKKRKRRNKREERRTKITKYDFEQLLNYNNWATAFRTCRKNVSYKYAVQSFSMHATISIYDYISKLSDNKFPFKTITKRIFIRERGKERKIVPITIERRMFEHVLVDNVLFKVVRKTIVNSNCASQPNKGTDFGRDLCFDYLKEANRKWRGDFYIVKYDIKSYFESIPLKTCYNELMRLISEADNETLKIIGVSMRCLSDYRLGDASNEKDENVKREMIENVKQMKTNGISLGSQVSQLMAILVLNKLDHYIKDEVGCKYYVRYMDDGIMLFRTKEKCIKVLDKCREIVESLGLKFNEKKTRIIKSTDGFEFLKVHYRRAKNGVYYKVMDNSSTKRERIKLKKFKKKLDKGLIDFDSILNSYRSYESHAKNVGNNKRVIKEMKKLFYKLFGEYMEENNVLL